MDWTAIITAIISGLLSITAISVFLAKFMPKISGWAVLAKDAVETLADVSEALKPDVDGKVELTAVEVAKINADVNTFKVQLALLTGK